MERPVKKRPVLKFSLGVISLAIVGAILYLWFIPIDLTRFNSRIATEIESRTGRKVSLETLTVKALPAPHVTVGGLSLYHENERLATAEVLSFRFSLIPALLGDVMLEDFRLDGATLDLKRDASGKVNLAEFLKLKKEKDNKIDVRVYAADISNGHLTFEDSFVPGGSFFELKDINGNLKEENGAYAYRAEAGLLPSTTLKAEGKGDWDERTLSGTMTALNINLDRVDEYLRVKDLKISGTSDLYLAYGFGTEPDKTVKGVSVYKDLLVSWPTLLRKDVFSGEGSASVQLRWDEGLTGLIITDARLLFGDFSLEGSLSLLGPAGDRSLALDLTSSAVPFETVGANIPLKVIPPQAAARINDIVPAGGTVTVRRLHLAGPIKEFRGGRIFKKPENADIDLILNDLAFRHPKFKEPFTDVSGRVYLKGDGAEAELSGKYSKEVIDLLKAEVRGITLTPLYNVELKGVFDAEETLDIAKGMVKWKNKRAETAIKNTKATGWVDLSLSASGSLKGDRPVRYSGKAELNNGGLFYKGFEAALKGLNGKATFDETVINIETLKGTDGFSTFSAKGRVEGYRSKSPFFEAAAEGSFAGRTVSSITAAADLQSSVIMDGTVEYKARARGNPSSFVVESTIDAAQSAFGFRQFIKKEKGFPLKLESAVRLRGKEAEINYAALTFGSSRAELRGSMLAGKPVYDVKANAIDVNVSDIAGITPVLLKDFETGGTLSFDLSAARQGQGVTGDYSGEVKVRDVKFKTPLLAKPVERINATAHFEGNRGRILVDGLSVGSTEATGWLELTDITNRKIEFRISSPRLFTEDIIPPPGQWARMRAEAEKQKAGKPFTGRGTIEFKEGSLKGHAFQDLRANITLDEKTIYLNPASVIVDRGLIEGNVTIYRGKRPELFDADFRLDGIDLEGMLKGFGVKKDVLTGRMRGRITLTGTRAEPFTRGIDGNAIVYAERGRLWKFPLLSNIFSIVNIVSIDEALKQGLPYKTISGDFMIQDGVITSKNVAFDSDSMRMSSTGRIDLNARTIDATLALHPFVTIDKIISKIPLAGWIITGQERSTVSMYFDIEGDLKHPDIDAKPAKTIEKGVLGILERLIKTPLRLFKPEEED